MAYTDINSEDRFVQKMFAEHLRDGLLPRVMGGRLPLGREVAKQGTGWHSGVHEDTRRN